MGTNDEQMTTLGASREEIEQLHDAFVEWYCHGLSEALEHVERALGPTFERVGPDGSVAKRDAVLEFVRKSGNEYEPGAFSIRIENVEPVDLGRERALVRYDEWQETPEGTNGLEWRYLQETWLEPPRED